MTATLFDIDLDFADRTKVLSEIMHIPASMIFDEKIKRHPSGIYVQPIPVDPDTDLASIEYLKAQELGYFKIDFLNVDAYAEVRDRDHLRELISKEPDWSLMTIHEVVDSLFQLNSQWYTVKRYPPTSVEDLSILIALIRPAKKYLVGRKWDEIKEKIWLAEDDGYKFKRSHAIGYATIIKMQLNIISEKLKELD